MNSKLVATFTRVKRNGQVIASFQSSHDAIIWADEMSAVTGVTLELWTSNHYETRLGGVEIEENLMMVSNPITKNG